MRRNFSGAPLIFGILYFMLLATPKSLFKYLFKVRLDLIRALLRGIGWNLANFEIRG